MRRSVLAVVAVVLLGAGCAEAPYQDWEGTIEERDGVTWVNNPAADPSGDDKEPAFTLHLEQTFGAEEAPAEALLAFVTGATVDEKGNVYVIDRGNDRLVAFAPDGAVMWTGGRSGQGPGEFEGSTDIAYDGTGLLYVDNRSGAQVDAWTTAGEYVGSHGLTDFRIPQGYPAGVPDARTVVLWAGSRTGGDGAMVHVFDVGGEWNRTAEFFALGGRESDSDEPGRWAHAAVRIADDSVWVGNRMRYELRQYGLDGTLKRVIAREHPELMPTFVYRGTGFGLGSFEPPLWLSNDRALVPRHWLVGVKDAEEIKRRWDKYLASRDPDDDIRSFESAIDLVDGEGRVLGSVRFPGAFWDTPMGRPATVGSDGSLYTIVFEPYPHVRRYRVELHR